MNLEETLRTLRLELEQVKTAIKKLEELQERYRSTASRRGRQSMSAEEREEVSRRMKLYWAGRRRSHAGLSPDHSRTLVHAVGR